MIKEPLLPNLDFKLRVGNSLIQKFGELDFTLEDLLKNKKRSAGAGKQLNDYIKKKKAFIQNQSESGASYENLKSEESAVFRDLITEMIIERQTKINNLSKQASLFKTISQQEMFKEDSNAIQKEIEQFKTLRNYIRDNKRLPFSYDIDFMEVFLAKEDNPGFDLIIGNPPYVKENEILPPDDAEYLEYLVTKNDDGKYIHDNERKAANQDVKNNLNKKVFALYPFLNTELSCLINGEKKLIPIYGKKINAKSDLYAYFQLICPSFLNRNGTFCFIISNSWLDVDFGNLIQQFFLKHCNLNVIYDCCVRSFEAKINTIIYIHDRIVAPSIKGGKKITYELVDPLPNTVRFVLNKIDYTQAAYAPLLIDQENCSSNTITDFFRCLPKTQQELFDEGFDFEDKKYHGEKWHGLFFKSSEIFLKLNTDIRFSSLGTLGEIKLGLTSCQNDFFYIDGETQKHFEIESNFLKPIFKTPQEINTIAVRSTNVKYKVLLCDKSKRDLKNTNVEKYIKHGEKKDVHKVACLKSRALWYNVGNPAESKVIIPYSYGETYKTHFCKNGIVCDKRFVIFFPHDLNDKYFACLLNSSLWFLFVETYGSSNLGEGALVFNTKNFRKLKAPNVNFNFSALDIESFFSRPINDLFTELGFDKNKNIRSQSPNPLSDRKLLDDIIFNEMKFSQEERNEIYWNVAELVKQRLDKAASR